MSHRSRVSGVVALVVVLALAALAGCGGSDSEASGTGGSTTPPPSSPGAESPEGNWALTQLVMDGAIAPIPAGVSVDAAFAGARVSGHSGVNSYSGAYTATADGKITVGPLASTQMAGPAEAMAVERAYLRALEGSRSWASDGATLTLYSEAGVPLLAFDADAASVAGAWKVTGYNNGAQAVVSVVAGSTITADFADDGTLSGTSGVNTYRSDYTTEAGAPGAPARITISPPASTRKGGPQDLLDQEQRYLAALESAATYTVRGKMLELRDGSDAIAATMTRS